MKAPIAKKIPFVHEKHGHQRIDPYQWINERGAPEVIDYLNAENQYYEHRTKHTNDLKESLFQEMKSRIKEDDSSVPYLLNGYWYIMKLKKGQNYPLYYRRKDEDDAIEELLFDVNEMAIDHDFYKLTGISISPDNKTVAYAVDTTGRRQYTICIKNIKTGEVLNYQIENTTGSAVWAADNKTLFFCKKGSYYLTSISDLQI